MRERLAQGLEAETRSRMTRETERRDLVHLDALVARLLREFNRQMMTPGNESRTADEVARIWLEREKKGEILLLEGVFTRLDFVTDLVGAEAGVECAGGG